MFMLNQTNSVFGYKNLLQVLTGFTSHDYQKQLLHYYEGVIFILTYPILFYSILYFIVPVCGLCIISEVLTIFTCTEPFIMRSHLLLDELPCELSGDMAAYSVS